jgi:hypothetical protein
MDNFLLTMDVRLEADNRETTNITDSLRLIAFRYRISQSLELNLKDCVTLHTALNDSIPARHSRRIRSKYQSTGHYDRVGKTPDFSLEDPHFKSRLENGHFDRLLRVFPQSPNKMLVSQMRPSLPLDISVTVLIMQQAGQR